MSPTTTKTWDLGGHEPSVFPSKTTHTLCVNPDVTLEPHALKALCHRIDTPSRPVLLGAALIHDTAHDTTHDTNGEDDAGSDIHEAPTRKIANRHVNAYGMCLTHDGVGINVDRHRSVDELGTDKAISPYLCPTGALFLLDVGQWKQHLGPILFAESLFLYMEDVALGIRARGTGLDIAFVPEPLGQHRFSASTGQRSALKLYYVERNRVWVLRTVLGTLGAWGRLPFSILRYGAYAISMARASREPNVASSKEAPKLDPQPGPSPFGLLKTLAKAWWHGYLRPVPDGLTDYLKDCDPAVCFHPFVAPLSEQLKDPTA